MSDPSKVRLEFSYNWNNKLSCPAFTTLRLHNPKRYYNGAVFEIILKGKKSEEFSQGIAEVRCIRTIPKGSISDFMSYIDTGYSRDECMSILSRMYPNSNDQTMFDYVLLVKVREKEKKQGELPL